MFCHPSSVHLCSDMDRHIAVTSRPHHNHHNHTTNQPTNQPTNHTFKHSFKHSNIKTLKHSNHSYTHTYHHSFNRNSILTEVKEDVSTKPLLDQRSGEKRVEDPADELKEMAEARA